MPSFLGKAPPLYGEITGKARKRESYSSKCELFLNLLIIFYINYTKIGGTCYNKDSEKPQRCSTGKENELWQR
jgi:hypothetical protein